MSNKMILVMTLMSLTGCSLTVPVRGDIGKGQERFIGTTTGFMDGSGKLTIRTETGIKCDGLWNFEQRPVSGSGTFKCADGRTGTFDFTSDGQSGIGIGRTNKGEPFKFSFGQNRIVSTW